MATTVDPASKEEGRPYDPPQRTKAMPKHTLFGAEVQQFSEEDKKAMKELDLEKIKESHHKERLARQQRYKPSLPSYLKKKLSGKCLLKKKEKKKKKKVFVMTRVCKKLTYKPENSIIRV